MRPVCYGDIEWDYRPTEEDSIDPYGRERPSTSNMLPAPSSSSTPLNSQRRHRALSVSSRGSGRSNDSTIREKEAEVKLFKELRHRGAGDGIEMGFSSETERVSSTTGGT
jgi:hypothetical protein